MKKITLKNYMTDKYYPKIVKAVDDELKSQNFVRTDPRYFISMGLLEGAGHGKLAQRSDSILRARSVKCNLSKASRILRILRFHAHDLNLKPSVTVYRRKTSGGKIPLRFS